jgi:hypothetical protein
MAKKEESVAPEEIQESAEDPVLADTPEIVVAAGEEGEKPPEIAEEYKQYHVGNWYGRIPIYKCPHCAWDTHNPEDIDPHISTRHPLEWMKLNEEEE